MGSGGWGLGVGVVEWKLVRATLTLANNLSIWSSFIPKVMER